MLHLPLALIPSSACTTSGSPFSRPGPGTWCFIPRYPLFLRRHAPRPPLLLSGRAEGRGASSPASPCSFVGTHHVRLPYCSAGPGDVVLHLPPALISSSRSTTSGSPFSRPGPGTWCLITRYPLFLRPQAPRQATQTRQPAPHASGYCKISIFLDKCVLKGNFFYGIISIRRYTI